MSLSYSCKETQGLTVIERFSVCFADVRVGEGRVLRWMVGFVVTGGAVWVVLRRLMLALVLR